MFLARTVTHSSVRQCQREIDAREYQEWQELYKQEPWGDDWMQTGVLAASNVNLWSKRKIKPERFIPRVKERRDPQQLEREMMQWARMHNAAVERKQRLLSGDNRPDQHRPDSNDRSADVGTGPRV
jgi:hypothetical protein